MTYELFQGDCRELLRDLPDECIDAIVTDPPYELGFMGKRWDASGIAYNVDVWRECLRVLKPGGHLLAFGGTRTYHRMACAIEDAGFEVRDSIHWIYGSGFPKSMDVSKAIDKAAGKEREVIGLSPYAARANKHARAMSPGDLPRTVLDTRGITAPATDAAKQWQGWGTALKPAFEPVIVAAKPATMGSCLSMLRARLAEEHSASSQNEFVEAFASALLDAGRRFATRGDSCAETDTWQSASAIDLSLNTVSSWQRTWEEASARESTSTTSTETNQTTDSAILLSCLSKITDGSTRPNAPAFSFLVRLADDLFRASALRLRAIQTLAATESATGASLESCQGEEDRGHKPIVVARKPLDGTVSENVLAHGTGALNIDGTRVAYASESDFAKLAAGVQAIKARGGSMENSWKNSSDLSGANDASTIGRWPPNILLNHSPECGDECAEDCPVPEMDRQGDKDGASRFFPCFKYEAKAGRKERERGCESLPTKTGAQAVDREEGSDGLNSPRAGAGRTAAAVRNSHPTVKPVELMRWLVKLVTPPNGCVLDPFTGSGTTGMACMLEGFEFVGFEQSAEYIAIAEARIGSLVR